MTVALKLRAELLALYRTALDNGDADGALAARVGALGGASPSPESAALIKRYQRLISLSPMSSLHELATPSGPPPTASSALVPARARMTASRGASLPVVVTSLVPGPRFEVQRRCFDKWLALGFEVYTVNAPAEADRLGQLGVAKDRIIALNPEQTWQESTGLPRPAIVPVLRLLQERFSDGVLLVNADLYPAAPDAGFIKTWRKAGSVLGLLRRDVLSLAAPLATDGQLCDTGIDGFLLDRDSLDRAAHLLPLYRASARMCFGVAGWDMMMGAFLHKRLGGQFIDSVVLRHEIHEPAPGGRSEAPHYVNSLRSLGFALGMTHAQATVDFFRKVGSIAAGIGAPDCALSQPDAEAEPLSDAEAAAVAHLTEIAPSFCCCYGLSNLANLARAVARRRDLKFAQFLGLSTETEPSRAFGETLLLLLLFLELRGDQYDQLVDSYQPGNKHAAALLFNRDTTEGELFAERLKMVRLFATELTHYKIGNPRLYNYLATCCQNDDERALTGALRHFLTNGVINAAA